LLCLVYVRILHFQCTVPFPISKHMQFAFPMSNVLYKCMYSMLSSGTSGFTANEMTIRDHVTFMWSHDCQLIMSTITVAQLSREMWWSLEVHTIFTIVTTTSAPHIMCQIKHTDVG
jgi:hypothetical protein